MSINRDWHIDRIVETNEVFIGVNYHDVKDEQTVSKLY